MIPLGLLHKELRQLLPWAIALYSVEAAAAVADIASAAPDFQVWAAGAPIFGNGEVRTVWLAIWALILAYAGFPREHDDGTLAYLFSLPISRSGLFLGKAFAAALVLLGDVVLCEGLRWLFQLPNPATISGQTFRLGWAWLSLWASGAVALIALGYALFLSVLRRFGVLAVFLVATVLAAVEQRFPTSKRMNALTLLDFDFHGTDARVPWTAFALHGALALALAAAAGYLWVGRIEGFSERVALWVTRTRARVLLAVGVAGTLVGLGFVYGDEAPSSKPEFGTTAELDGSEAVVESGRYRFRFPTALRERVVRLAPAADALHDRVASALGSGAGASIDVDMTKSSRSHAGSATWSAIRLDLGHAYDDRELLRTLTHETAHVIALRVSDRRLADTADSTRFFDEGLAEHLAYELVPHPAGSDARWLEALLARRRLQIETDHLFDFPTFSRTFGEPAIYPVAFSWVVALCATCGNDAPARVLRALAKPSTSDGVAGQALWRRVLQEIGCDATRVELGWAELIRHRTATFQPELERVPDLSGGISRADDEFIVFRTAPAAKALEGSTLRMYTRVSADDRHAEALGLIGEQQADGSVEFLVATDSVDAHTLHFQLAQSWIREGALVTHAGKWQKTRIPSR